MKTIKIRISGIVQGVFFRKFAKENADRLRIRGFVRNLNSGKVEIVAEGRDENVNEFLGLCSKGPSHANIKDINVEEINHQGFESFRVLSL